MNTYTKVLAPAIAFLALALGVGLWTGRAPALVQPHMALGVLFVAISAVVGWRRRSPLIVVLGALLLVVGVMQRQWILGDAHWLVQVIHVGLGVATAVAIRRVS
jgi:hypothetical protein